jgi:hypothetical protein
MLPLPPLLRPLLLPPPPLLVLLLLSPLVVVVVVVVAVMVVVVYGVRCAGLPCCFGYRPISCPHRHPPEASHGPAAVAGAGATAWSLGRLAGRGVQDWVVRPGLCQT